MSILKNLFLLVIVSSLLYACKTNKKQTPVKRVEAATIQGNFSTQTIRVFDSTVLVKFLDSFPLFSEIKKDLNSFYKNRNYAYAWFDEKGMIEQAGNLFNRIKNIGTEGIDSSRLLYQDAFNDFMENHSEDFGDSSIQFTELMLTSQYLFYAKNVWQGINEKESIAMRWLIPRKKISYTATLDSLLSGKDLLENPPVYRQYYLLKDYLEKYKNAEGLDTVTIKADKPSYKIQDTAEVIGQVRYKLFLLGDIDKNSLNNIFDESLKLALKNFQQRIGLNATGILKKAEIDELNIPIH